jgi:hypothetical protein
MRPAPARVRVSAAAMLLAVALAACGSTPTSSPSPSEAATQSPTPSPSPSPLPTPSPSPTGSPSATPSETPGPALPATSGPSESASAAAGFTIEFTPDWQPVELTEAALQEQITSLGPSNPQLASILRQLLASGQYRTISFFAYGFDGEQLMGTAVGTATPVGGLSLDGLAPLLEAQFKQLGATDYRTTRRTLPAGDALVLDFALASNIGGTVTSMLERDFALLRDGTLYQATFTCTPVNPTACRKDADLMATSLAIAP